MMEATHQSAGAPKAWWRLSRSEAQAGAGALLATLLPPLVLSAASGLAGALRFFAYDSFIYLGVARQSSGLLGFTLDGVRPVSGFHPLWELVLRALFLVLGLADHPERALWATFALSALLVAGGAAALAAGLVRGGAGVGLAILGVVPGPFYLVFGQYSPDVLNPWSHVDGMESGLVFLSTGLLVLALAGRGALSSLDRGRARALQACLAVLVLSRLDEVFVLAGLALLALRDEGPLAARVRRLARLAWPAAALLGAYMAWNTARTGLPVPVSGLVKSGPALLHNLRMLPLLLPDASGHVGNPFAFRAANLFGPLLVVGVGALARRAARSEPDAFLAIAVPGVLLKSCYVLLRVNPYHQGQWYFVLAGVVVGVLLVKALARSVPATPQAAAAALAVALLLAVAYLPPRANSDSDRPRLTKAVERAGLLRAALLQHDSAPRILEMDDGVVGFLLGFPTTCAMGFGLDVEAWPAFRDGRLLQVAWDRGDRYVASLQYLFEARGAWDPNDRAVLHRSACDHPATWNGCDGWEFRHVLTDPGSQLIVLEFSPAGAKATHRSVFRLRAAGAREVLLAGSFDGWRAEGTRLADRGDGVFEATLDLPPGEHAYRFRVDGAWRTDPDEARAQPGAAPDGGDASVRSVAR
jgi:hypothetical protein